MIKLTKAKHSVIISTNQYSGNFEREMGAYITGQVGECEVGKEQTKFAYQELNEGILEWFEDNIEQVPDEHGCCRPVNCISGPEDKACNSVEIFFYIEPMDEILDSIKRRAFAFTKQSKYKTLEVLGIYTNERITTENIKLI